MNRANSRGRTALYLLLIVAFSCVSGYAATPDRITGTLRGATVSLHGNVPALANSESDIGLADRTRVLEGVTLAFRPSTAQQRDLDDFIATLQDRTSPNYHKFLTPKEFGKRFGLSHNDIDKVVAWLTEQGFTNIRVANNRNEFLFDATVGQIESAFHTEMHNYRVDDVDHVSNATEPKVPAAMAPAVLGVERLNDFVPKRHLTSFVSGNHFLSPGDFAVLYDVNDLYSAGATGSNQTIAVIGQSTINPSDLAAFRTAAGLSASTVTTTLVPSGSTATRCTGDELEAEVDLEWTGGVAMDANLVYIYAGLGTGDTCTSRSNNVWNALQYAVDNNIAPFVSLSYGACEPDAGQAFADQVQGWAQQGITQGQTIVAASGNSGAAGCDAYGLKTASLGLAVDIPASIPEVTGVGGTEFTGDHAGTVTGSQAGPDAPYWLGSGDGTDTVITAEEYIPEEAWNDTLANLASGKGGIAASGGGASTFFTKPSWQTGTGVPDDGQRDVPDLAVSGSIDHDGYLLCSEDNGAGAIVATCTNGFRNAPGADKGTFTVIGGSSVGPPTLAAILALVNQYVGNSGTSGLAPVNPTIYQLAASNPTAFNDVTTGNNVVPCKAGTTGCSSGSYGYDAGTGYDQVTGWGSVNVYTLAKAWPASTGPTFTVAATTPASVAPGSSTTSMVTITPENSFDSSVAITCSGLPTGATCSTLSLSSPSYSGTLTINTTGSTPAGTSTVTVTGTAGSTVKTTTLTLTVTGSTPDFGISATALSPASISAGKSATSTVTIASLNSFSGTVTLSCSGLPQGATCSFNPATVSGSGTTTLTVATDPTTAATSGITVTVTGTSGSLTHNTTLSLAVTATTDTYTLTPSGLTSGTLSVAQGATSSAVTIAVSGSLVSGGSTIVPVTYTCSGLPTGATCAFTPASPTSATSVALTVTTTAPSSSMLRRNRGTFYAVFLPGLLGLMFTIRSRKRSLAGMRLLGLVLVLGCSTVWLASCSSSGSSAKTGGTPVGTSTVTVNAVTNGAGTAQISSSFTFTLSVTAQ